MGYRINTKHQLHFYTINNDAQKKKKIKYIIPFKTASKIKYCQGRGEESIVTKCLKDTEFKKGGGVESFSLERCKVLKIGSGNGYKIM